MLLARSAPRIVAALVLGLVAGACGAKTGLLVPDAQPAPPGVDAGVPCYELGLDAGPLDVDLETAAEVGRADVAFLIDTTASMGDEINQIRGQLRDRLVPSIRSEISDSRIGVATFADFPVVPFGTPGVDDPFILMLPESDDISRVQAAVNAIQLGDGRDEPESQVEALYQVATGAGIGDFVAPSAGCPSGGVGFPCFRRDAFPVVLLFTDAAFHNGPGMAEAYGDEPAGARIDPPPHTYAEMIEEVTRLGIRVIGFDSGDGQGRTHLEAVARDTGAVDGSGSPLVFDIGRRGEALGVGVVDAIRTFAETAVFDVDVVLVDLDPTDGVDVTAFVEEIIPDRAIPMSGIDSIDFEARAFRGVQAGTRVVFVIRLRNDAVVPGRVARRFLLRVVFRADGRNRIGSQILEIVIPGEDGVGCPESQPPSLPP